MFDRRLYYPIFSLCIFLLTYPMHLRLILRYNIQEPFDLVNNTVVNQKRQQYSSGLGNPEIEVFKTKYINNMI
jgi:hypothetical protein